MATDVRYRFIATDDMGKTLKGINSGLGDLADRIGGPVGEALSKFSGGLDKIRGHGPLLQKAFAGIGTAAMGLGALLSAQADKEKVATAQLKAAVEGAGAAWEPYHKKVEGAAKVNERYGYTSRETQLALAKMTLATKNPQAAIENLGLAVNIAAAKHIELSDAAGITAKLINGNAKAFKGFGVSVTGAKEATAALTKAQREQDKSQRTATSAMEKYQRATEKVSEAQQALKDKTTLANADGKITVAESVRLQQAARKVDKAQRDAARAHDALTAAQGKARASAKGVATAQQNVANASKGTAAAIKQVTNAVSGQATAQAESWTGKWKHAKAVLDDFMADTAGPWGTKILAFGGSLSAFAALFETQIASKVKVAIVASGQWIATQAREAAAATANAARQVGAYAARAAAATASATVELANGAKVAAMWAFQTAKLVAQRTAMLAVRAATVTWTAAQWLLNAAMNANPIGIAVVAIAALAAGVIYAYKHSEKFRNIVHAAMHGAGKAISWVVDRGEDLVGWFKGLPGKIGGLGKGLVNVLTAPYRTAFHYIAMAWNSTAGQLSFHVPDWVPTIGGKGFSMPHLPETIPALAKGGIIPATPGGRLVLAGEGGRDEAVVPLPSGGLGGGVTRVTISVQALDSRGAADAVIAALRKAQRSGVDLTFLKPA